MSEQTNELLVLFSKLLTKSTNAFCIADIGKVLKLIKPLQKNYPNLSIFQITMVQVVGN
ncbi:hypothetical protein [Pseudolactococcus chungangensis]|jgi:hypothetical protein|uniref:hypothetical protein n=1 Tax=Pseudolactococcus chungangensis TaxID=451457 RepID=UPI0015C99A60|nr:hypothetical protein [Lactococcus chungangensis]